MNAAVEIHAAAGIGGSILNWYYVGPTAFYCFLLIFVRCYFHSSDEGRRRGGNGTDDHHDVNNVVGPTGVRVELQPTTGIIEQQSGHDAAEGGGGRETGDQGHTIDLSSAGSGSGRETVSAEEAEGIDYTRSVYSSSSKETKQILGNYTPLYCMCVWLYLFYLFVVLQPSKEDRKFLSNREIGAFIAGIIMVTGALLLKDNWICKRIGNCCFGWCLTVFEFGSRILRQLGLELNDQEGDSQDGEEGGGGTKTGDPGTSSGCDWEIVSSKEGDEHSAEGTSSDDVIKAIDNVLRERRKQAVPGDHQQKVDFISDRKSAATGSNFFGKSLKSLSTGKED